MYIKNRRISNIIIYVFLISVIIVFLRNVSFSQDIQTKNILILKSKCKSHLNTHKLMKGIRDALGNSKDFSVNIEIINFGNNSNKGYERYKTYKKRFEYNEFDIVIPCDNISLEFVRKYQSEFFKETPIIFCNITDDYNYKKLDKSFFTGIISQVDIKGTLDIALKLHPNIRKIIIATNENLETISKEKLNIALANKYDIEFILWEDMKSKEFKEKIEALNGRAIFLCSDISKNYTHDMCIFNIKELSSDYKIPVYSLSEVLIDKGVVGGMILKGYDHGEKTAKIALRVLNGEKVENISVTKDNSNRYSFDYNEMKRFGIKLSDIPKNSEVINKDSYGFYISKELLFYKIIPAFILFLILIIFIQLINIFKLKKIKQELKESEERLRTIINATPDIIFIKDGDGKLLDCNQSLLNTFDLDGEHCIGRHISEVTQLGDIYRHGYSNQRIKDKKVWERGSIIQGEDKICLKDGTTRVYDLIKVPVYKEDGSPKAIVGLGRDITSRKHIEDKLRESEERYRTLLEFLPMAVCLHCGDTIEFINTVGIEMIRVKGADELIGRSIYNILHPDYHEEFQKKIEQLYNKRTVITSLDRGKIITATGESIDIECISKSIFYNGKKMILSVASDMRERKKVEELRKNIKDKEKLLNETLEYDKLKTELFANVSHELRTPLNVILGAAQMSKIVIDDGLLDNNSRIMKKYLNMIQQNTYRLIRIVNNLIDINKMDSGFFQMDFQNCDIVNIVENITYSVAEYIKYKKINLIFDTNVEEKIIACDPDKIERIMLNLLSNATKFTELNGEIGVNMYDKESSIVISVKDNGIGIPNEKLKEVFEKFKQVDKSFKRSHEGSGIGLFLVKSLVEMHEGTIWVKSEYGKGSEFIIEIPAHIISDKGIKSIADDMKENHVERVNIEFSDIYK